MSSLTLAIQAVKDKIALAAGTATPEELAYLGTALDRIGGRATVYEVVEVGDTKKAELADLANTLFASIQTDTTEELTKFVEAVDAKIAAMTSSANTLVDTSIKDIASAKASMDTHASETLTATAASIDSAKTAAITAVSKAADDANTAVKKATDALSSASAAAVQQSINGSLYNLYYFSMV
jgi:hypothetical protein